MTSFTHAMRGIAYVFRHEKNFRVQVYITIVVMALVYIFELTRAEIVAVIFIIAIVLILEIINTAMEKFFDVLKPRLHGQVGDYQRRYGRSRVVECVCGSHYWDIYIWSVYD